VRTNFKLAALCDPHLAEAERNLRACVHCGICTATCPTYVLLGDERDGPRGRIVMIQQMLEQGGAPSAETVRHVDRCLSCLGCRTACPSGVDYAALVDTAREHIEAHHRRSFRERFARTIITHILAQREFAKVAVLLARTFAPIATRLPGSLGKMARIAAQAPPRTQCPKPAGTPTMRRIALLRGCVQPALAPHIDEAVTRSLDRRGIAAVPLERAGCCGALAHHLGRRNDAKVCAKRIVAAFEDAQRGAEFESVLVSATGCAAQLKAYPRLLAEEPAWKERAIAFAAKVREFSAIAEPCASVSSRSLKIAYQVPCSLQYGLRQSGLGEAQLRAVGFDVVEIPEGHICCGSAGSYSILQPAIADALRARKLSHVAALKVDAIASPNIGCFVHLMGPDAPPVVHPAELIDWAEGGPVPAALRQAP
jgi:glycolate dehydrogenase iron-sulfur subunit